MTKRKRYTTGRGTERARRRARPRPPSKLDAAEREFLLHFQKNGGNATRAYLAVHPYAKTTTAATEGWRLLRKPEIRRQLEIDRAERWGRIKMDADEALQLLANKARADIRELFDEEGELLPIARWPDWMARCIKSYQAGADGAPPKITLHDGLKALELVLIVEGKLRNKLDVAHSFDLEAYLAAKTPA